MFGVGDFVNFRFSSARSFIAPSIDVMLHYKSGILWSPSVCLVIASSDVIYSFPFSLCRSPVKSLSHEEMLMLIWGNGGGEDSPARLSSLASTHHFYGHQKVRPPFLLPSPISCPVGPNWCEGVKEVCVGGGAALEAQCGRQPSCVLTCSRRPSRSVFLMLVFHPNCTHSLHTSFQFWKTTV